MSNLQNKCPKCGLPYCNPVGGRGACWEIDGNGCLERQLAAAVKERNEARDLVWVILAMTGANDDEIAETIKCSKPVTSAIRDASLVSAAEDIARRVAAEAKLERIRVAAGKWKRTERYTDDGIPDAGDVALLDTLYAEFGKDGW